MQQITLADVNYDGVDELLVIDENGQVSLVDANGQLQWSYQGSDPALVVAAVNIDGPFQPTMEIALGTRSELILLSTEGDVLWQIPIPAVSIPATIFTDGGEEAASSWQAQYHTQPTAIAPLDVEQDGRSEILLLLQSGQLQLYDFTGKLLWRYGRDSNHYFDTHPQMTIGDLDSNGQDEIVLAFFNTRRFSEVIVIGSNGEPLWAGPQPISGRVTTLALIPFRPTQQYIAVGSTSGEINLYAPGREKIWLRTRNKAITALTAVQLSDGPALAAGTEVGTLVIYDINGRPRWTRQLDPNASQGIVALFPTDFTPSESQPALSVTLGQTAATSNPTDVYLLSGDGRILDTFPAIDTTGLTRLADINHDQNSELILARFATIELLGLGSGSSETARDWEWLLLASPRSSLVVDFEQDGNEEVLIGADDGRLHRLDNNSFGYPRWIQEATGSFTHLAPYATAVTGPIKIVAVRNNTLFSPNSDNFYESWIELRQPTGERIWEQYLPTEVTSLFVGDVNNRGEAEIVVGTRTGQLFAYTSTGASLWSTEPVNGSIEHLTAIRGIYSQAPELIAATSNQVFRVNNSLLLDPMITYPATIHTLYPLNQPGRELTTALLVFLGDGTLSRLSWRGIELPNWENIPLSGFPLATLHIRQDIEEAFDEQDPAESFLVVTTENQLTGFTVRNNEAEFLWQLTPLDNASSLHWGDLDGDTLPELVVGGQDGKVFIFSSQFEYESQFDVSGPVTAITAMHRESEQRSDLLVVTGNGSVQLFRAQENHPPLLTKPATDISPGQYNFSVVVSDVEQDTITVHLEIFDPASRQWITQAQERQVNGDGSPAWVLVAPPVSQNGVLYRFFYDDGFHQGYLSPPPGPPPVVVPERATTPTISVGLLSALGLSLVILIIRQIQSPSASARRFYGRLKERPQQTLIALENKYIETNGSPDFLLSLSSRARQQANYLVAGLADGLFLLTDRPHAALPILISAIDEAHSRELSWKGIQRWRMIYRTGHLLLEAPSITELSLLRPQWVELLALLEAQVSWSPVLDALLPILTNLRDSERVEMAEDRLVYLNEAASLLNRLREQLPEFSPTIEKMLVTAVLNRWSGLVSAEIAELRGRAELVVTLKTRQLAPSVQTNVAMEIRNNGRAPAEHIIATLDENPAYTILTPQQEISLLPPGRTRQIMFTIEPKVDDRFRLALGIVYDDRTQKKKVVAFADMVHLLPPMREFKSIPNPYLPGTPLRQNSSLFYGRDELFQFIAENAGRLSQRSVLILTGQRRTGKTSMLLRLGHHLPENLLPIYIDCQSLGVTPGMPSLLYDLAWHIADALAARGIRIDVPETAEWQADPNGQFQRYFLPQVRNCLPANTTLLLVFDEFEAFENLVNDNILPATFFTYMRHLMQHSTGLSFVFVGTRRLEEMSADYWSVLFNIALYKKIGYLSEQSASRLIREPVAPNLIYDDLAVDKILRVTAGHPYFLQLVCYTLVQQANNQRNGYVTISDVNAALDEMLRLGEAHFAYLWQRSSQIERALLTAVSHLMDESRPFHPAQLVEYLKTYTISPTPTEVTTALNQLVERDILQEVHEEAVTLYELKISLVGLWVSRHKSLSKLYSSNGEERGGKTAVKRKI